MSRLSIVDGPPFDSFPRVSGDEPAFTTVAIRYMMFSPRERG